MHAYNNALSVIIDTQDGGVARLPLVEENNDLMEIKGLIAIGKVASFAWPLAGNKLAMSASSNMLHGN